MCASGRMTALFLTRHFRDGGLTSVGGRALNQGGRGDEATAGES